MAIRVRDETSQEVAARKFRAAIWFTVIVFGIVFGVFLLAVG